MTRLFCIFVFSMLILVIHVQRPCCLGGDWKRCPIHSIFAYYCMARHCLQHTEMCRQCIQYLGYLLCSALLDTRNDSVKAVYDACRTNLDRAMKHIQMCNVCSFLLERS